MRIVLLDAFTADQGQGWTELAGLGEVIVHPRTAPDLLAERCAGADAVLTNKAPLDGSLLRALPGLRYIGVTATGTNIVDIAAARERGIAVTNVPGYSSDSVAQLVFAMALHFAQDVAGHGADTRAGKWQSCPDFCFFRQPLTEMAGKVLAIVGLGAIGRTVARIGAAFGMEVAAAEVPGSSSRDRETRRWPLAELLPRADLVTLHCPLTPATESLVDARFLAAMKPGALLINTSRGGLIDEGALLEALRGGRLGGAALDVLRQEPPPAGHPLLGPEASFAGRLLITPHIAWGTVEARGRLRREVAENLAAFARGERRNRVD